MKAPHLVIAIALPAIALPAIAMAAVESASVTAPQHHASVRPVAGGSGRLLAASRGWQRVGTRARPALRPGRSSTGYRSLPPHARRTRTPSLHSATGHLVRTPANVDYASGGYGAYNSGALRRSWVQGVVINLDWSRVETSPGHFKWTGLDRTAAAWAHARKHIALVVRATNEIRGGCSAGEPQFLPGWEIKALHNALGAIGTFCDKALRSLIPDWFSSAFRGRFLGFIRALGKHVSAKPYYQSISYVRIGVGLAGEGFYLRPHQAGYAADKAWMVNHWHYTPQRWEGFQKTMLGAYDAAFPAPVQVIYPIDAQDDLSPHNPVELAVAKWATNHRGIGIGEECLPPGGFNRIFSAILGWVRNHHPHAYMQFQTCGQTNNAAAEHSIIRAAERYRAKSIEWYENTIMRPPSQSALTAYQSWVNRNFRS